MATEPLPSSLPSPTGASEPPLEPRPEPPVAPTRLMRLEAFGHERVDPYAWLADRDDPEVIRYLEAENAYTEQVVAALTPQRDAIFEEIRSRVVEDDVSAPVRRGGWDYFTRTYAGRQYAIHGRRPAGSPPGEDEQVLLDENELAGGSPYFALGGFAVSPSQRLLAYSTDHNGSEQYTLRFRDLEAGTDLPESVTPVYYGLAWLDDETICFVRPDAAMRPYQVWRHRLRRPTEADDLVWQEDDERFFVSVRRTRSGDAVLIDSHSKMTSEVHWIPTSAPDAAPRLVAHRTPAVEYSVEHHRAVDGTERFVIVTNADGARDGKVMIAALDRTEREHWVELLPASDTVKVEAVDAFATQLVVSERSDALERLRVLDLDDTGVVRDDHVVTVPDPVHSVWIGPNAQYDTRTVRYGYASLVQPESALDYDVDGRTSHVVKRQEVPGYDPGAYTSARHWAVAADGTRIPVSVVHRADLAPTPSTPLLLYGYGAYELSTDPTFSVARVSLLDRGFVFAIAHVRGGGEFGRRWYEEGRLDQKRNTFTDFIAAAEHLVAAGMTSPARLGARGGSAGGLLMGAVMTMRPELFRAIVAEVPFVDVVTTMRDPSIPLTVTEWEEWGDPLHDEAAYRWMLDYSPYDHVEAAAYPALFVTAGLYDPRVQYWEPAKLVAKLRAVSTGDRPILLKTQMGAGHGGASGRYDAWRDEALVLAFLVDQLMS